MRAPKLASNRSPMWAFFEKFEVPDYDVPSRNYLARWRLVQTPWFGVYLHRLDGPDPRPTLHDHPWGFLSIILRGGYGQRRLDPLTGDVRDEKITRAQRMRTHDAHSIRFLERVPTWTLLLVGPRCRRWGYLDPMNDDGWRWTRFDRHPHAREFDRAMAARYGS